MTTSKFTASGLVPYEKKKGILYFLVLKNSHTKLWEFPKGIVEDKESILRAAIRETIEETGLDFTLEKQNILSPMSYSYSTSNGLKEVFLFPIHTSFENKKIIISNEHSSFKIIPFSEVLKLIKRCDLRKLLFELKTRLNFARESETRKSILKTKITHSLNEIVSYDSNLNKNPWFLTGSIAHNEHTIYGPKEKYSDIDLVKLTCEKVSEKSITEEYNRLKDELEKFNIIMPIGIYHLNLNDKINLQDPFWSAFYHKNISINGKNRLKDSINFQTESTRKISYNIFRTTWYKLIRGLMLSEIQSDYHFIKAIAFVNYVLNFYDKHSFVNYEFQRNLVIESLMTTNDNEKSLFLVLKCLDIKLSKVKLEKNTNWKETYLAIIKTHLENNKIDDEPTIFTKFLVEYFSKKEYVDFRGMTSLFTTKFGIKYSKLFEHILKKGTFHYLVLIMLILLRLELWPEEVKFSRFKYNNQIKYFFNKYLAMNDTSKEYFAVFKLYRLIFNDSNCKNNKVSYLSTVSI